MSDGHIGEHGEIFEGALDAGLTPYQVACRQLVAFKLKTIETVAADPRLHSAPCVQAIIVYMSFLTIDKNTLKPSTVYASALTLMARGGIKSDRTARNARRLLTDNKYLVPAGSATKDGCARYHVANPGEERVRMHVLEATEYLKERDADRKKEDRRKRLHAPDDVPVNFTTPQKECPGSNYQDVPVDSTDNYHRGYLGGSCSEGREGLVEGRAPSNDNPYASVDDDPTVPFNVPSTQQEAEETFAEILAHVGNVNPIIAKALWNMFMAGNLSPALLKANLGGGNG